MSKKTPHLLSTTSDEAAVLEEARTAAMSNGYAPGSSELEAFIHGAVWSEQAAATSKARPTPVVQTVKPVVNKFRIRLLDGLYDFHAYVIPVRYVHHLKYYAIRNGKLYNTSETQAFLSHLIKTQPNKLLADSTFASLTLADLVRDRLATDAEVTEWNKAQGSLHAWCEKERQAILARRAKALKRELDAAEALLRKHRRDVLRNANDA